MSHLANVVSNSLICSQILPPKFSRMFKSLVGKTTYLKDSTGQTWEVVLSVVEDSLGFQKGWRKFYLAHGIEQGDFVVFHYIAGSHFTVEIYDRSAYEKNFPGEESYQNKRPKTTRESDPDLYHERQPPQEYDLSDVCDVPRSHNGISPRQDDLNYASKSLKVVGNVRGRENINKIPQVVPEADLLLEPCFITGRETGFAREDNREHLLDLSAFELPDFSTEFNRDHLSDLSTSKMTIKKVDATEDNREHDHLSDLSIFKMTDKKVDADHMGKLQVQGKKCSQVSGALHKAQNTDASIDIKKRPIIQGNGTVLSTTSQKNEVNSRSECKPVPRSSPRFDMSLNAIGPLKTIRKSDTLEFSAASGYSQPPGGKMRIVKQEPKEFNKEAERNYRDLGVNLNPMENNVNIINIVKSEPVDSWESASARITCLVPPDNESFLELPEPLPIKGRRSSNKKLIYLRNPSGKDWPVLCHIRYGLQILSSGWNAFTKANNIRPGDVCAFVVDDIDKGIFHIEVLKA